MNTIPIYTLRRSRRKSVSLEVTREMSVLVRAPLGMSKRDIDRFVATHTDWIAVAQDRQIQRVTAETALAPLEPRLRSEAKAVLPARVAFFSGRMGLVPAGVRITGAKTRFGSCSAQNRLCFSWRLMAYPPEAVDYVVVHELAHIRHKNHGAAFYALIEEILPDYRERVRLLRQPPTPPDPKTQQNTDL